MRFCSTGQPNPDIYSSSITETWLYHSVSHLPDWEQGKMWGLNTRSSDNGFSLSKRHKRTMFKIEMSVMSSRTHIHNHNTYMNISTALDCNEYSKGLRWHSLYKQHYIRFFSSFFNNNANNTPPIWKQHK